MRNLILKYLKLNTKSVNTFLLAYCEVERVWTESVRAIIKLTWSLYNSGSSLYCSKTCGIQLYGLQEDYITNNMFSACIQARLVQ